MKKKTNKQYVLNKTNSFLNIFKYMTGCDKRFYNFKEYII